MNRTISTLTGLFCTAALCWGAAALHDARSGAPGWDLPPAVAHHYPDGYLESLAQEQEARNSYIRNAYARERIPAPLAD